MRAPIFIAWCHENSLRASVGIVEQTGIADSSSPGIGRRQSRHVEAERRSVFWTAHGVRSPQLKLRAPTEVFLRALRVLRSTFRHEFLQRRPLIPVLHCGHVEIGGLDV